MRLDPGIDPLDGRLRAQRKTREVILELIEGLRPGDTERETACRLRGRLEASGAVGFFHEPVVWFGERSTMSAFRRRTDALPGGTRLGELESAVIDVAPAFRDGVCDVSWSGGPAFESAKEHLRNLRASIPEWVNSGLSARELTGRVMAHGSELGWKSCQPRYVMGALGHRVYSSWTLLRPSVFGLGFGSGLRLFGGAAAHRLLPGLVDWPFWNDSPRAERPPSDGLWSVEPHFCSSRSGWKWEELLVIENGRARWLDPEDPFA